MVTFEEAIRYPMAKDDWLKTVLIGGLLLIFSFLIISAIAVYGYLMTVIKTSLDDHPEPPPFEDWVGLLRKGVLAWIIGRVYLLVTIVVATITIGGSIAAMSTASGAGQVAGVAGMFWGLGLSFVLTLVFGYFAVVALVNFARTDEIGAAFDFTTIKDVAFDGDYLVAWLLSIAVFIVASVIGGMLNLIPLLGAIVGAFLFFYAEVVAANLWAGGFSAAFEGASPGAGGVGGTTE